MNNVYAVTSVPSATPTIIASILVPPRGGYSLKGVIVSGEVDTFVEVIIGTDVVSAGHVTGATPNMTLDFTSSPFGLGSGDIAMIRAYQTSGSPVDFNTTILVEQL